MNQTPSRVNTCRVPGCQLSLRLDNTNGVCAYHQKYGTPPAPRVLPDHVEQVPTVIRSYTPGVPGRVMMVSLPKRPWAEFGA